jgi:hypothetical protein
MPIAQLAPAHMCLGGPQTPLLEPNLAAVLSNPLPHPPALGFFRDYPRTTPRPFVNVLRKGYLKFSGLVGIDSNSRTRNMVFLDDDVPPIGIFRCGLWLDQIQSVVKVTGCRSSPIHHRGEYAHQETKCISTRNRKHVGEQYDPRPELGRLESSLKFRAGEEDARGGDFCGGKRILSEERRAMPILSRD